MLWWPSWQPYWIFGVRKSSKWVYAYTNVFGNPRNIEIDNYFFCHSYPKSQIMSSNMS